jgi:hypothetical protein
LYTGKKNKNKNVTWLSKQHFLSKKNVINMSPICGPFSIQALTNKKSVIEISLDTNLTTLAHKKITLKFLCRWPRQRILRLPIEQLSILIIQIKWFDATYQNL